MVIGPVNNNNLSSQIQRNLNNLITRNIQSATEQLTSGLRINQASDDAAGLINANNLQVQIEGLNAAINNAQGGVSVSNIADQGLGSITGNLQRIRELTIQAGNSTLSQDAVSAIQTEINQNIDEINRTANTTQFTSNQLLNNSSFTNTDTTSPETADAETSEQANIQVGDDPGESLLLNFGDVRSQSLGLGEGQTVSDIDITQEGGVSQAIQIVDAAIGQVGGIRAEIGAGVNRLTSTISSLSVTSENLLSSQSRIQDTDFARAATQLATSQLQLAANVRLLLQANDINRQSVLGALQ